MALLERKIFVIILLLQLAILLVYIITRNLPTELVKRHPSNRVGLHTPLHNLTRLYTDLFFQRESSPNIGELSTRSVETNSSSIYNGKPTTYKLDLTSDGGGETTRSTSGQTTQTSTTSQHTTTERKLIDNAKTESETEKESETWFQKIDGKPAWLYSAYFDYVAEQLGKPSVRIFGIIQRDFIKITYCTINTDGVSVVNPAAVVEFPDSHGVQCPPIYIVCGLPANTRPTHISISFQRNETATNRLQIIYPGSLIRNFTVCYSILHSGYNFASQLIQSLEMNRILGAEHFVVYNYSVSPAVDQILRRYQQDGLLTVLPWPLPTKQSWYYGQTTALNDCFYRNRNISRFVVVVDTDEVMTPHNHSNWMDLIAAVSPEELDVSKFVPSPSPPKKANAKTGCFIVRSSFFTGWSKTNWTSLPSEFPFSEEEKNNTKKYNILTLSQFVRSAEIYPPRIKSKYIARPELTYNCGIHLVHSFIYFMRCKVVPNSLALIHHYRKPSMVNGVLDTSTLRFKSQLYPRVMKQFKLFPNIF